MSTCQNVLTPNIRKIVTRTIAHTSFSVLQLGVANRHTTSKSPVLPLLNSNVGVEAKCSSSVYNHLVCYLNGEICFCLIGKGEMEQTQEEMEESRVNMNTDAISHFPQEPSHFY